MLATDLSPRSFGTLHVAHRSWPCHPNALVLQGCYQCLLLFFRNFTASPTSSLKTRKLSMSVVREVLSFFGSLVARYEYRSAVYSVHLFKMSLNSVRHFPFLSRMVLSRPCLLLVSPFTTWYAFLALFAFRFCLMSMH